MYSTVMKLMRIKDNSLIDDMTAFISNRRGDVNFGNINKVQVMLTSSYLGIRTGTYLLGGNTRIQELRFI